MAISTSRARPFSVRTYSRTGFCWYSTFHQTLIDESASLDERGRLTSRFFWKSSNRCTPKSASRRMIGSPVAEQIGDAGDGARVGIETGASHTFSTGPARACGAGAGEPVAVVDRRQFVEVDPEVGVGVGARP